MQQDRWQCDVCCGDNDGGKTCKHCSSPRGTIFEEMLDRGSRDAYRRQLACQEAKSAARAKWKQRMATRTALTIVWPEDEEECTHTGAPGDEGDEETKCNAPTPAVWRECAPPQQARHRPERLDVASINSISARVDAVDLTGCASDTDKGDSEDRDAIDLTGSCGTDEDDAKAHDVDEDDAKAHDDDTKSHDGWANPSDDDEHKLVGGSGARSEDEREIRDVNGSDAKRADRGEDDRDAKSDDESAGKFEDDSEAKAGNDDRELWKCCVCFHHNKALVDTCLLCSTPGRLTFTQALELERTAQLTAEYIDLLSEDASEDGVQDTHTNENGLYSAGLVASGTAVEDAATVWKCHVCRHHNSSSYSICGSCGTEDDGSLRDVHAQPAVPSNCTGDLEPVLARPLPPPQVCVSAANRERTVARRKQRSTTRAVARRKPTSKKIQRQPYAIVTRRSRTALVSPQRARPKFLDARWPCAVASLRHHYNPMDVRFGSEPPFGDKCDCDERCRQDTCRNGKLGFFCLPNCCKFAGNCGNALNESQHLRLVRRRGTKELAVLASERIDAGVIIGEYLGQICVGDDDDTASSQLPRRQNEYRFKMKRGSRSHPRKKIYVDAEACGGITRFLNHSCTPTAHFHEASNGTRHTVVVVTARPVEAEEEITVNYGDQLWFICRCGESVCCHKNIQHLGVEE